MPLDPQAQRVIEAMAALNLKPVEESTPAEARESIRTRTAALGPFPDVAAVVDHRVPVSGGEITVRAYSPDGPGPHPALVYYHGGGWVIGDLYTHDGLCRSITNAARCAVLSVDYRLAPESKYPVAVEDSYAALLWIVANAERLGIDRRRIAVGGDSAGGNLATVTAIGLRDGGGFAPRFQLLIYPGTDMRATAPSHTSNGQGYVLTADTIAYFRGKYVPDERQWIDWRASPLLHEDLTKLPPALVLTAGYDPLRDEGRAYADALSKAGVPTQYVCFERQVHGFITMGRVIEEANTAVGLCAMAVQRALSTT
jgi:acetyl esterase